MPVLLLVAGALLVVGGLALASVPAALVVAGALVMLLGWDLSK